MRITDAFRGEHGVFYAQFDVIERIVPTAQSAAEVRGLAEMLAAALVPHAKLEDELLFNPLDEYAGPDADPIEVMRFEHDDIEKSLMRATTSRDLGEARELLLEQAGAGPVLVRVLTTIAGLSSRRSHGSRPSAVCPQVLLSNR